MEDIEPPRTLLISFSMRAASVAPLLPSRLLVSLRTRRLYHFAALVAWLASYFWQPEPPQLTTITSSHPLPDRVGAAQINRQADWKPCGYLSHFWVCNALAEEDL